MRPGAAFQRRITLVRTAAAWPAVVLVILYLMAVMRLPPAHDQIFLECVVVGLVALGPLLTWLYQRLYTPIARVLDRQASGEATSEELREAWRAIVRLPVRLAQVSVATWTAAALAVVGAVALRAEGLPVFSSLSIFMALVAGGGVSEGIAFFLSRRAVEPERLALAAAVEDPDARRSLIQPLRLAPKLRVTVTGVTLLTVAFAVVFSLSSANRSVEQFAARMQNALLDRLGNSADPVRLAALEAEARELGVARHLLLLDAGGRMLVGQPGAIAAVEVDAITRSEDERGDGAGYQSPNALAWRRFPDGRVVVAIAPWNAIAPDPPGVRWIVAAVLVVSTLIAWLLARVISDDLSRATSALRGRAQAVADGDLRRGQVFDGEDEMGALGRGFDRMAASLRAMVGRVAETATRVERATAQLGAGAESVSDVTVDQVNAIRCASDSMDRINRGVKGIAESSEALTQAVDASSSVLLELGAVESELTDSASDLSAKVESVSSAVEEMAASVREVAGNADALSSASSETSGSMEEMASSVREVEVNASETARLSGRVVGAAEQGRERVAQTIAGMEVIRSETETAREVVRNLGARAAEIGGILNVINDVADETNLLALNAAIIAAQAGENGRAFAVVADQIKALADRVLISTREIEERIRGVQEETANAAAAIERGSGSVRSGVGLSAEAGRSLEEITAAARESGQRVQEIVGAMREQTQAAAHVVKLMEQVQAGVESIRRASREQARGNELILNEAVDMREVARRVRGTTQEQEAGTARIGGAFDGVRAAVGQIHEALQEQSEACARAAEMLEAMSQRTSSNESSVGRMTAIIRELLGDAEALRRSVSRFGL